MDQGTSQQSLVAAMATQQSCYQGCSHSWLLWRNNELQPGDAECWQRNNVILISLYIYTHIIYNNIYTYMHIYIGTTALTVQQLLTMALVPA